MLGTNGEGKSWGQLANPIENVLCLIHNQTVKRADTELHNINVLCCSSSYSSTLRCRRPARLRAPDRIRETGKYLTVIYASTLLLCQA